MKWKVRCPKRDVESLPAPLPPQALDDANKGIIGELKKTNYRDLIKVKKEKGRFLEPLRGQLYNSPCACSSVSPSCIFPLLLQAQGLALSTTHSAFSATSSRRGRGSSPPQAEV